MVSILNFVFTIIFYVVRWSKLDLTYIYFEKNKSIKFALYFYMFIFVIK
jgi:hypothetical protein